MDEDDLRQIPDVEVELVVSILQCRYPMVGIRDEDNVGSPRKESLSGAV